ncbi:MAG: hypothetical protein INF18_08945 [Methylobacterium sp.]|nr:hypothetical protein [Methylobacterium sp.]MCA3637301.1 hypothetical protein [Methylobacterium sp.]
MEKQQLSIVFEGDAHPRDIPIEKTIQILRSYNSIIRKSAGLLYGPQARIDVRLNYVKDGSYDLSGIVSVIAGLQPIFPMLPALSLGASDILALIKQWLDLSSFLQKSPPISIRQGDGENNVSIVNRDGEITNIHGNVYQAFILGDVGSLSQSLQAPLQAGAHAMRLVSGKKTIARYGKKEIESFVPIRPTGEEVDTEIEVILLVVSPVLEGEGVWKFKFGTSSIVAKTQDKEYLKNVLDRNISFKHGDRIRARLRNIQRQQGARLITNHYITKVIL